MKTVKCKFRPNPCPASVTAYDVIVPSRAPKTCGSEDLVIWSVCCTTLGRWVLYHTLDAFCDTKSLEEESFKSARGLLKNDQCQDEVQAVHPEDQENGREDRHEDKVAALDGRHADWQSAHHHELD